MKLNFSSIVTFVCVMYLPGSILAQGKTTSCQDIPVSVEIKDDLSNAIRSDGKGLYDGTIFCNSGNGVVNLLTSNSRKVTVALGAALDAGDPYRLTESVKAYLNVRNLLGLNVANPNAFSTTFGSTLKFAQGDRELLLLNPCSTGDSSGVNFALVNSERTTAKVDVVHTAATATEPETWVATVSTDATACPGWPAVSPQAGAIKYEAKRSSILEGYYTAAFQIVYRRK